MNRAHDCLALAEVTIKKLANSTKFKVRCTKYLYTLVVADKAKAEKVKQSLRTSFLATNRYYFRLWTLNLACSP